MVGLQALVGNTRYLTSRQRPPSMRLHLGASLPAWALRLLAFGLAASAATLLARSPQMAVLLIALTITVPLWPGIGLPAFVAGVLGWTLLTGEPDAVVSGFTVLLVHAFLVLSRVVGAVGWKARVEFAALARVGRPFLVIQFLAQSMMQLAYALPAQGAALEWIAVAVLAVLVALTAALARRLRTLVHR